MISKSYIKDVSTQLIETPSPTGEEFAVAKLLVELFKDVGLKAEIQMLYENRGNAIGRLKGSGKGPTILFSGHMDTSVRGDEDYLVGKGFKNEAVIEDDCIYGNGIYNMKQFFVISLVAVNAMQQAGIKLPGDIIVAGTVGEIERAPVDEYYGREYDSYGVGLRHLLVHGCAADYHVLGEPTGLTPFLGQMGTVWAKVTTHGEFSHTAYADQHINAVDEMVKLWKELDPWITDFKKRNVYMGVVPQINKAAMRGGLPFRAARTPNKCSMYIDIRFPPDQYPIDIQREFSTTVNAIAKDLKLPVDIDFYMSRPGTLIASGHPLVQTVMRAHKTVTGSDVEPRLAPPFQTDAIDSMRYGIPTLNYGAGRKNFITDEMGVKYQDQRAKEGEFIFMDDIVTCGLVYAVTAMELNKVGIEEIPTSRGPMPGVESF